MWSFLEKFALFLLPVPERASGESEEVFRWRLAVALSIITLGAIEVMFILFAVGFLSLVGVADHSGFALKADIAPMAQQLTDDHLNRVTDRIAADRTLQCQGMMEGNKMAMDYSYRRLQEDVDEFNKVTRATPRTPDCNELIPGWTGYVGVAPPVPAPTATR